MNPTSPEPTIQVNGLPLAAEVLFAPWPDDRYPRIPLRYARLWGAGPFDLTLYGAPNEVSVWGVPGYPIRGVGSQWQFGAGAKLFVLGAGTPLVLAHRAETEFVATGQILTSDSLGLSPDPSALQTEALQSALSQLAKDGGGTLVLKSGLWRTGTLTIGSKTRLHLADGAILRGSDAVDDYPLDPRVELRANGRAAAGRALLRFSSANGAALTGSGRLDGNGRHFRRGIGGDTGRLAPGINLIRAENCQNLTIAGVELVDAAFWNTHLVNCERVILRDLLVINELPPPGWVRSAKHPGLHFIWNNTDGIVPDGCRDVLIEDFLAYCGDDGVPIKSTGCLGPTPPTAKISVRHGVIWTPVTALKVGTETNGGPVSELDFANLRILSCARAFGIDLRDDAIVSDVRFRQIVVHQVNRWFDVHVDPRSANTTPGRIENVLFDECVFPLRVDRPDLSTLQGASPTSQVCGVRFNNLRCGAEILGSLPTSEVRCGSWVERLSFSSSN